MESTTISFNLSNKIEIQSLLIYRGDSGTGFNGLINISNQFGKTHDRHII
jgi:hypothetical protein